MFRSLSARNYRIWFAGALVSNVGTWMQRTAQDWLVLTKLSDNDAIAVGITMALQFGPQLLLLPLTGLAADRFDRRKMLMLTQGLMGALGLGLGIMVLTDTATLWSLYGFALALGIVAAFDTPIRQAFVSDVVQGEHVANAVALNSASFNAARLVGPAVAGVLIAVIGTDGCSSSTRGRSWPSCSRCGSSTPRSSPSASGRSAARGRSSLASATSAPGRTSSWCCA